MLKEHMARVRPLLLFWLVSSCIDAQSTYPFKERFDALFEYYSTGSYSYDQSSNEWYLAWGWNLDALLGMWETTGDKDYAYKFVKYSYNIQMLQSGAAGWPIPSDRIFHYTGELINPMARFAYLAYEDGSFSNIPIPSGLIPTSIDNISTTTVGEYAAWLGAKVYDSWSTFFWAHWDSYLHL